MLHWFWPRQVLINALAEAQNDAAGARRDAEFWKADSRAMTGRNAKLITAVEDMKDVVKRCREERDDAVRTLEEYKAKACCRR